MFHNSLCLHDIRPDTHKYAYLERDPSRASLTGLLASQCRQAPPPRGAGDTVPVLELNLQGKPQSSQPGKSTVFYFLFCVEMGSRHTAQAGLEPLASSACPCFPRAAGPHDSIRRQRLETSLRGAPGGLWHVSRKESSAREVLPGTSLAPVWPRV